MDSTLPLAVIAIHNPGAIDIFNRFNLDYYCNGKQSLSDACRHQSVDAGEVRKHIDELYEFRSGNIASLDAPLLSSLLLSHYTDFDRPIAQIEELLDMAYANYVEDDDVRLRDLIQSLNFLKSEILDHNLTENTLLLESATHQNPKTASLTQLDELLTEHHSIGDRIRELRSITLNYSMTHFHSPFAEVLGILLQQLDKDITQRLHIENNMLFPKFLKS
jgi:regulator of cell morphogenesis and NO signaling